MSRQDGGTHDGWPPGKPSHTPCPKAAVARAGAVAWWVAAFLLLGACGFTPQGDLIRDVVKQGTQKAGDAGLRNAEWFLCEAAPVGAVKRRYGSANAAEAYAKLCDRGAAENIIKPRMVTPTLE